MASLVKGSIPKAEIAKKYYEAIAQRFKESEKAVKRTKLQELEMTVDEDMMVHFALNSLPKEFKSLRENILLKRNAGI
ncbi:unnamed protein product [Prunus armeniaca]